MHIVSYHFIMGVMLRYDYGTYSKLHYNCEIIMMWVYVGFLATLMCDVSCIPTHISVWNTTYTLENRGIGSLNKSLEHLFIAALIY